MADQLDADCEETEETTNNSERSEATKSTEATEATEATGVTEAAAHKSNGDCQERGDLMVLDEAGSSESSLSDLEESLQALERLDRSSPDLWPDHIPGVGQFLPQTPYMDSDTPRGSEAGGYLHNLSREELETLMQLGGLSVQQLVSEVKRLQNVAYQLGQEESKEMTRGKYLNILKKKNSQNS